MFVVFKLQKENIQILMKKKVSALSLFLKNIVTEWYLFLPCLSLMGDNWFCSLCLIICLSLSVCLAVYLFDHQGSRWSAGPPSQHLSVCLSVCRSVCLSVFCLSNTVGTYLSLCLSISQSVDLSNLKFQVCPRAAKVTDLSLFELFQVTLPGWLLT
jgi:hypothetical protein